VYSGHLAVALAATRARPRVPLWLLLIASQAPDWLELLLKAAGRENSNEVWSHSIPVVTVGAILFASYYLVTARNWSGALVLVGVALSHSVLDLVTGAKALWPGQGAVGACLYDRPIVDFAIEVALSLAGWAIYRSTLGRRRSSSVAWAILITLIGSQTLLDAAQQVRLMRAPEIRQHCIDAARN
jgi:LexA-binding, inner membrane-associated putative hydrolase